MRIYVAAKFEEKANVRRWYERLTAAGFTVTHDWTVEDDSAIPAEELRTYHAKCAKADVDGVRTADAMLMLPHARGQGMFIELGVAIAHGLPVIVIHDDLAPISAKAVAFKPGVFFALPNVQIVPDDFAALAALKLLHTQALKVVL